MPSWMLAQQVLGKESVIAVAGRGFPVRMVSYGLGYPVHPRVRPLRFSPPGWAFQPVLPGHSSLGTWSGWTEPPAPSAAGGWMRCDLVASSWHLWGKEASHHTHGACPLPVKQRTEQWSDTGPAVGPSCSLFSYTQDVEAGDLSLRGDLGWRSPW